MCLIHHHHSALNRKSPAKTTRTAQRGLRPGDVGTGSRPRACARRRGCGRCSVRTSRSVAVRDEAHRRGVHAVAEARRRRSVWEDVAEVRARLAIEHLHAARGWRVRSVGAHSSSTRGHARRPTHAAARAVSTPTRNAARPPRSSTSSRADISGGAAARETTFVGGEVLLGPYRLATRRDDRRVATRALPP